MNDKELTFSEKEDIYYQIKNFKFRTEFYTRENRLDEVASWAIWNPSDLDDTKIIEKPESIKIIKPNYVFVLLNFAGNGDVNFDDPAWVSWKNFHFKKSQTDKRLFNVLKHPKFEGSYMTDIIKCVKTKGEEGLREKLNNNEINMETQVNIFIKEISILDKNNNVELFLMGRLTEQIYNNYMVKKLKNNIKATYIIHPSARYSDAVFYEKIKSQLGINE
jgi:hypothetical protein